MAAKVIEMKNISKSFYNTRALQHVDFTCRSGEVHAVVGLNGAGKSTLINTLGGVILKDEGEILLNGKAIEIKTPIDADGHGISIIHQEYSLINELSIVKNIFLGKEIFKKGGLFLDYRKMEEQVDVLLRRFDLDLNPRMLVKDLNSGEKQFIEIIRAIMSDSWLIVMDEPTSALSEKDKLKLFEFIEKLTREDIGIIYISHHMPEIFGISDEVTIMADGQKKGTYRIKETTENDVITQMIGEDLKQFIKPEKHHIGDDILEVKNLNLPGSYRDINFTVRKGEIVVLTGLRGSGCSEVARTLYGLEDSASGEVMFHNAPLSLKAGPGDKIKKNIGFVSANRDKDGILPVLSVKDNISLPYIDKMKFPLGFVNEAREKSIVNTAIKETTLKTESPECLIKFLSGGNKQKACFGRWLDDDLELLILQEPTRGVDVHAKAEIYRIIEELSEKGVTVVIVSYEVDEVLICADRVLVLFEGRIVSDCSKDDIKKDKILAGIAGVTK